MGVVAPQHTLSPPAMEREVGLLFDVENCVNMAVEETPSAILGEGTAKVFYSYMLRNFNLKQDEVALKPEIFSQAVDKAFGKGGRVIERMIIRKLCNVTGLQCGEIMSADLVAIIRKLREHQKLWNTH